MTEPTPLAPPARTNGFAIASLVFGILGGILLSVIFGIVALVQLKNRNERGKGMAIAGLVLSGVWTVAICIGLLVFIVLANRNGEVQVENLRTGDCVNQLVEGDDINRLPRVECSEPHQGEVVGKFSLEGSTFPGEDSVNEQAESRCFDLLDEYSPSTKDDDTIGLYYVIPTRASWAQGDREVICMAEHIEGPRTGSIRG